MLRQWTILKIFPEKVRNRESLIGREGNIDGMTVRVIRVVILGRCNMIDERPGARIKAGISL